MSLFAGAFTFGSLVTLPRDGGSFTTDQIPAIAKLLSASFVCFSTALLLTVALQIILRRESPDAILISQKRCLVSVHFGLIGSLVIAGFIVLNCILIVIGQWGIGSGGIVLLGLCAVWIIAYWVAERKGGYFPTARDIELGKDNAWSFSVGYGK